MVSSAEINSWLKSLLCSGIASPETRIYYHCDTFICAFSSTIWCNLQIFLTFISNSSIIFKTSSPNEQMTSWMLINPWNSSSSIFAKFSNSQIFCHSSGVHATLKEFHISERYPLTTNVLANHQKDLLHSN